MAAKVRPSFVKRYTLYKAHLKCFNDHLMQQEVSEPEWRNLKIDGGPPPCSGHTLTRISDYAFLLFGGTCQRMRVSLPNSIAVIESICRHSVQGKGGKAVQ